MKIPKTRIFVIVMLISLILLGIIPIVYAKQRKTYLTDFLVETHIEDKGFSNSIREEDEVSYEATAYALEIMKYYNLMTITDEFGNNVTEIDSDDLKDKLEDTINDMLEDNDVDLYELYYLLKSLNVLDSSISSSLEEQILDFIDDIEQDEGGFAPSTSSTSSTISSTYFAIAIYPLIDESIDDYDDHVDWIKSCQNGDGGYGGDLSSSSTIVDTYYAISIMDELKEVDDLEDIDETIEYLNSFYVDNENDVDNFGGYLPDEDAEDALLSSTYYCVRGIFLLDEGDLEEETQDWVLSRQNFRDGGFIEIDDGYSSVISSGFAFNTLKLFDENLLALEEQVFMVEFNWWLLLIILTIIGLCAVFLVIRWRKRRI